ncbi:MAG: O-antigen ligase C-terminal domain-containing protein [Methylophaga sp.]|nr:O-antigen ligase C-terminal domain-containing protein [Methylophaga sp.]
MQPSLQARPFKKWTAIEWLMALLLLVAPFYYHANLGGSGLRITHNVTIWIVAVIIVAYSFLKLLKQRQITIPPRLVWLAAFPLMATFSGFITGISQPTEWLFRLLFIWAGLLFLISLFQHQLSRARFDRLLMIVVISALLHALVGTVQIIFNEALPNWLPPSTDGLPRGLFQQINNMATYQSAAIIMALYLTGRPMLLLGHSWLRALLTVAVLLAAFVIASSGSRVALLSLISALCLILLLFILHRSRVKPRVLPLIAMVIGLSVGWIAGSGVERLIDKPAVVQTGYSGDLRVGIYLSSWLLIQQAPVFGHGIGSFGPVWQFAKPEFQTQNPDIRLPNEYLDHPHNELIFWAFESGLLAVIGILVFSVVVLLAILRAGPYRGVFYLGMLLPFVFHLQLELPFYLSASHWLVFLLILAVIFWQPVPARALNMSAMAIRTSVLMTILASAVAMLFLLHSLLANRDFAHPRPLTSINETLPYASTNPYFRFDAEWLFYTTVFYQLRQQGDIAMMERYASWVERQLNVRPDINLYLRLVDAYQSLDNRQALCDVALRGSKLYPRHSMLQQLNADCQM